jgi:predicted dehydrogenase
MVDIFICNQKENRIVMKNIALIGIGKMGLSHFAIANSTPGINIVAVCDTSKPLLRAIRKNLSIATYPDFNDLIQMESLDGVIVSVPNAMHFDVVLKCLKAGLDVFIEKPLTIKYQDSLELQKVANKHNRLVQVGFVNRFNLVFSKVKELLHHNVLGDLSSYQSDMRGGVVLEESSKGWRNSYAAGGGCLYDFGPHCIDFAVHLFGEDITLKSSQLESIFSTVVDDRVAAEFEHDNGLQGSISVDWSDATVRKATNSVVITGEFGKLTANKQEIKLHLTQTNEKLGLSAGDHTIYVTDLDTNVDFYLRGEDFSLQMKAFSDSLNGTETPVQSLIDSAIVTDRIISEILSQNGVENG